MASDLLLIALLIAGAAFFSVAEISMAAARRLRLRRLADEGDARALRVIAVQESPGHYFTVVQIGLNMAIPIPDLHVDEDGLSCTLSFNRTPHYCVVPWSSVYALVGEDGRGMVWPNDVPPEVATQMQKQQSAPKAGSKKSKAKLNAVEPGADADKERPVEAAPPPKAIKREPKEPKRASEGARPRPAAVPPPEPSEPKVAPTPAPERGAPGRKPKRELPPYLRVIK